MGKALLDQKQLDLPLSPIFWKLVNAEKITLIDILKIDKTLGKTLLEFQEIVNRKKKSKENLTYRGAKIKDLGLVFTLPGYDTIELKPNGKNITVSLHNLQEYIDLVTIFSIIQEQQAKAFKEAINSIIPISLLKGFTGEELERIICGETNESWDLETIKANITPDHGYTHNSVVVQNLLMILSNLTTSQQRKFLQFVTGSPRLPIGGFANLTPKLTIVKKEPSIPGMHADEYLPSVMTCQNYLKIPEYTSIEILERNLKYAMEEGNETFHLS